MSAGPVEPGRAAAGRKRRGGTQGRGRENYWGMPPLSPRCGGLGGRGAAAAGAPGAADRHGDGAASSGQRQQGHQGHRATGGGLLHPIPAAGDRQQGRQGQQGHQGRRIDTATDNSRAAGHQATGGGLLHPIPAAGAAGAAGAPGDRRRLIPYRAREHKTPTRTFGLKKIFLIPRRGITWPGKRGLARRGRFFVLCFSRRRERHRTRNRITKGA